MFVWLDPTDKERRYILGPLLFRFVKEMLIHFAILFVVILAFRPLLERAIIELTNGKPILFIGWGIITLPYAIFVLVKLTLYLIKIWKCFSKKIKLAYGECINKDIVQYRKSSKGYVTVELADGTKIKERVSRSLFSSISYDYKDIVVRTDLGPAKYSLHDFYSDKSQRVIRDYNKSDSSVIDYYNEDLYI